MERRNTFFALIEDQGSRSREIETRSFHEEAVKHDRRRKPVVCRDANHAHSVLNEVDIDFRIPRLSYSVVKQDENYRVRELVKKIENQPSTTCSSTRSTTKQSLQPVQYDVQQNDSGHGQRFGERQLRPMPFWKYQQRFQSSSSPSSWWQ